MRRVVTTRKIKASSDSEAIITCVRCWGETSATRASGEGWDSRVCWGCIERKKLEIEGNQEYLDELISLKNPVRRPHRTIRNYVRNYLGLNKRKKAKAK